MLICFHSSPCNHPLTVGVSVVRRLPGLKLSSPFSEHPPCACNLLGEMHCPFTERCFLSMEKRSVLFHQRDCAVPTQGEGLFLHEKECCTFTEIKYLFSLCRGCDSVATSSHSPGPFSLNCDTSHFWIGLLHFRLQ